MINIQVIPNIFYPKVARVCLEIKSFISDTSASFAVELFNDQNILLDRREMLVDGEEYADWADDDTYIENLILGRLALSRPPEIEE